MERSHEFKKYTFKTFTWCDVCNKFIWGARKQGYKCKICRMTSHKGSCKEKADTTTTCSQRLYPGSCKSSGVDTMNFTKKKVALESIKENIASSEYLRPYRVETFLALITNLPPEYLENINHYACFVGKIIPEIDSSDQLSVHLRFSVSDEVMDTLSVIDFWIEKGLTYEERYAALKVLEEISKLEENKQKILEYGHVDTITKILLPVLSRSELGITIEEMKLAQIVFKILLQVADTRERRLMLVDNDLLDRGISFLKILKKIEGMNLTLFKEKANRLLLRAARDEGYRFLEGFMHSFYDKDERVTQYLCSRQVLDLIIDAASRCVVNLAPKIDPQEIVIQEEIYSSVLCTVHSGIWKGKQVAIKVFHPSELSWNITNFRKEVTMFTLIKHPTACPFFGYSIAPDYDNMPPNLDLHEKPLILMPLIKNGSLTDYINARSAKLRELGLFGSVQVIDTSTLVNMAMNAANCIQFLHSRFIIHRDIKPANFLIDENFVVRVTDFGVSRAMETDMTGHYTYIGTEVWMAPEVFTKNYDYKADTYSFGLVLWSMLVGVFPYSKYEKNINFASIITSGLREEFPKWKKPIHPELKNLIESCWTTNHQDRPDFSQILDILHNMRCPYTRRYYTHIYDNLDEKTFRDIFIVILTHLDSHTRTSFYLTSKKFYSLLKIANNQSQ